VANAKNPHVLGRAGPVGHGIATEDRPGDNPGTVPFPDRGVIPGPVLNPSNIDLMTLEKGE
jgi:hypothetical protein